MTTYPLTGPGSWADQLRRAQEAARAEGYAHTGLVFVHVSGWGDYLAVLATGYTKAH